MADPTPKKQYVIEYITIAALVLVAFIIGILRFKKGDTDDEVFSRKSFNEKWKDVEILEAKVPTQEKEVSYVLGDDKTPFKGPFDEIEKEKVVDEEIVLPSMTFQGMIWKGVRPQAIINNKLYDINDTIDIDTGETGAEVKVIAIKEDGIHLKYKGKEFIVRPK